MKTLLALLTCMFAFVMIAFSQSVEIVLNGQGLGTYFASLASLPPLVVITIEFIKSKWAKVTGGVAQLFSWLVSIALTFAGWGLNIGMYAEITEWYYVLATGVGLGFVSNGIFDIKIVQTILQSIFKSQSGS